MFVSYAQNFEDVLLWRALKHVQNGFYIDVGANDPTLHSVTRAFYDAGWHGINIEPVPAFHAQFLSQRPRDISLAIAAGAHDGAITLYDVTDVNGWATTDRDIAQNHGAQGHNLVELVVPMQTLAQICTQHAPRDIHFLKIDVEGAETDVLRGMDFTKWRPWIVVVEATLPNSRVENHQNWEGLVTANAYQFVYFDGLNRYYVALEHVDLRAAFAVQPNVFDDFVTAGLVRAQEAAQEAQIRAHDFEARYIESGKQLEALGDHIEQQERAHRLMIARREGEHRLMMEQREAEFQRLTDQRNEAAQRLEQWARGLEWQIINLQQSTSWRVTAPLRFAGRQASRVKRLLRRIVNWLKSRQRLRAVLMPLLRRFPRLERFVTRIRGQRKPVGIDPRNDAGPEVSGAATSRDLPQSVAAVLGDLKASFRAAPGK